MNTEAHSSSPIAKLAHDVALAVLQSSGGLQPPGLQHSVALSLRQAWSNVISPELENRWAAGVFNVDDTMGQWLRSAPQVQQALSQEVEKSLEAMHGYYTLDELDVFCRDVSTGWVNVLLRRADLDSAVRQLWKADPAHVKQVCTRYTLNFKQIATDQKTRRELDLRVATRDLEKLQAKLSWTDAEIQAQLQGYANLNKVDLVTPQNLKDFNESHPVMQRLTGCSSWLEVQNWLGFEKFNLIFKGIQQFEDAALQKRNAMELFDDKVILRALQKDRTFGLMVQHGAIHDSTQITLLLCQIYAQDPAKFKQDGEEYVRVFQNRVDRFSEPSEREQMNQRVVEHLKEAIRVSEGYLAGQTQSEPSNSGPSVVSPATSRFVGYFDRLSLGEPEDMKPKSPHL